MNDRYVPYICMEYLAEDLRPNGTLKYVEYGHFPHSVDPTEIKKLIADFLA